MARTIALAVHQCEPRSCVEESVQVVVDVVRRFRSLLNESSSAPSAAPPALVVFSELFLGGYGSGDMLTSDATTICLPELSALNSVDANVPVYSGSQLLEPIRQACRESRVGVVCGYSERSAAASPSASSSNSRFYNSAFVVDDTGAVLASYRKVHLWGSYEASYFTAADNLLAGRFKYHGVECGVLICFDVEFPEATRMLRLDGAEVVLVPTALVNTFNARVTVPSRAFENNFVVCYANEVGVDPHMPGVEYCGLSVIALPDGSEGCRLQNTKSGLSIGLSVVDLDSFAEARARNNYVDARRPECYS